MIRFLPFVVELALLVFCLIDIIQTPEGAHRNLSKGWWILLVIVMPLIGCVAWLVAGRPQQEARRGAWGPGGGFPEAVRPPVDTSEIDRNLSDQLERIDREFEDSLRRSRDRLAAREQELAAREAHLAQREEQLRLRHMTPDPEPDEA